jgi:predicted metal-binding transcription factor (methanogenesis marker protein 9)
MLSAEELIDLNAILIGKLKELTHCCAVVKECGIHFSYSGG